MLTDRLWDQSLPGPRDNVPIGQYTDSPHRLGRVGDGLAAVAILPDAQCTVLTGRHEAVWGPGNNGDRVDKVGVGKTCLDALPRTCHPALDRGIVGAGQELCRRHHGQPTHTVCVAYNRRAMHIL